jgi:integrase
MAVRTFYSEFEIQLPRIKISATDLEREGEMDIPSHLDIKLAVEHANPKYAAMILLASSSGMGSAELRALSFKDFLVSLNVPFKDDNLGVFDVGGLLNIVPENGIPVWHINSVKTGMKYFTFSSPESVEYILRYLKNNPPKHLDSYLFPSSKGGQLSGKAFAKYFNRLNERCGFPVVKGKVFFLSHSLRKFFVTNLILSDVQQIKVNWFLGHRINRPSDAYFKATEDGLKQDYLKVLPDLVIMEKVEVRVVTDERIKEMEEEMKRMREQMDRYMDGKMGEVPPPE